MISVPYNTSMRSNSVDVTERTINVAENSYLLVNRVSVRRGSQRYNIVARGTNRECSLNGPRYGLCYFRTSSCRVIPRTSIQLRANPGSKQCGDTARLVGILLHR